MPQEALPLAPKTTSAPRMTLAGPAPSPAQLPVELTYGTVSWSAVGISEDDLDADSLPNALQINGWATFTAQPEKIVKGGPGAVTILPRPVRYQILNGRLVDADNRTELSLVGNDSPGTTPQGWSYHVDWALNDGVTFGSFDFYLSGGEHVDLSDVQPLDEPAPGVVITQGPRGLGLDSPSYVGARPGIFDAERSVYNLKASNTLRLRNALAAARAGTGLCRLTFLGDSLTAGFSDVRGTDDPVTFVRRELGRRGYKTGELVHSFNGGLDDPRISYENGEGVYTFPWIVAATGATISGSGTVLEIASSTATGPVMVSIDGGAAVQIGPGLGGPGGLQMFTIGGLSDGPHTATFTKIPGGDFYIYAAGFRQTTGVVVENAGMSGSKVSDWLAAQDNYGSAYSLFHANNVDHDAVFIELGMNDRWQGVTVDTYRAQLETLVDQARLRGATVILVVSNSPQGEDSVPTWGQFASAMYDVADSNDLPLIDLTDRWGKFATYNADGLVRDIASDGVHLTAVGNAAKAEAWLDVLSPMGAGEVAASRDYVDEAVERSSLIVADQQPFSLPTNFQDIVIANVVQDTEGGYDPATGIYTIPFTGTYDVLASVRVTDNVVPSPGSAQNVGLGVDVVGTNDSPFFTWYPLTSAMRQGFIYNRSRLFNAGQQVRFFGYGENGGAVPMQAASLSINLIRKA